LFRSAAVSWAGAAARKVALSARPAIVLAALSDALNEKYPSRIMPPAESGWSSSLRLLPRQLASWIDSQIQSLHPGSFALVMATGIVSNALFAEGSRQLSDLLFYGNAVIYLWLASLTIARAVQFIGEHFRDLFEASKPRGRHFAFQTAEVARPFSTNLGFQPIQYETTIRISSVSSGESRLVHSKVYLLNRLIHGQRLTWPTKVVRLSSRVAACRR
jgi:Voltage-dependent anion channel